MKPKTCRSCREKFAPAKPMQAVCSPACAIAQVSKAKAKAAAEDRKLTAKALVKLKTRATLIREAQTAFNAYIRARDAGLSCVSCGRQHEGQWHAGHFQSTGARPDLRFDEANVHKQCAPCNSYLSGNLIPYRPELIRRVGQGEVDRLEGPASPDKMTREQIIELRKTYVAKTRTLKATA